MKKSILITYLTSSKENWEVAEVMAIELKKQGVNVESIPAAKVDSLDQYQMIIFGAPIYMFIWPKELHRFLEKNEKGLKKLPVTIFSIGPSIEEEAESKKALVQIEKALAKFEWFKPSAIKFFNINFTRGSIPFPFNLFQKPVSVDELMDWAALKTWIKKVVKE